MVSNFNSPLAVIEPRLRSLLPADLYAAAWVEPSSANLMRVFEHLRTLQRIVEDYVPRHVVKSVTTLGNMRYEWQEGTLMFTDLAGFTTLLEANAAQGPAAATNLMTILNSYFASMIEIISKSGGYLLEFTGDAMLACFPSTGNHFDTVRAIRAGLRMQRAMQRFAEIDVMDRRFALGMRVGIHRGRFLTADIGTPRRMEYVLLGGTVRQTKHAEGSGTVGRVNITDTTFHQVENYFHFEQGSPGYLLVIDDLDGQQLGEYDIAPGTRRQGKSLLLDRSIETLIAEIERTVNQVEPLAGYLPTSILNLLVESAARRQIPPNLLNLTAVFVNFMGLPEAVDRAEPGEEHELVALFSRAFALINAAVDARGGVLKNVTYHLAGSDMLIYFGVPNAHTDDAVRAAQTALAIREVVNGLRTPVVGDMQVTLSCQIGIAHGAAFAAEIGEPRGRREFNVLGDTINTAARLMGKASANQILITEAVFDSLEQKFDCEALGTISLKGKSIPMPVYGLLGVQQN